MAMRRRRFTRRSGRRFGGVQQVTTPKRWQAANFHTILNQDVPQDPLLGTTLMIELAALPFHVGDQATGQGQTLSDLAKKFELGGVVFDIDVYVNNVIVNDSLTLFHFTEFLCTIALDQGGNPVVVPDFFQTQKPVAVANVNSLIAEETDFPTRIHWRSSYSQQFNTEDSTFRSPTRNQRPRFTKSLRLRRFLDGQQGLYLGVCAKQNLLALASFTAIFNGTLYYRVRF